MIIIGDNDDNDDYIICICCCVDAEDDDNNGVCNRERYQLWSTKATKKTNKRMLIIYWFYEFNIKSDENWPFTMIPMYVKTALQ